MTDPDYKIEEVFEPENMRVYFVVYVLGVNPYLIHREFDTLEEAKDCVRMLRKYKERIFHYVED